LGVDAGRRDPVAFSSAEVMQSYSKDAAGAANLLAAHSFTTEAEQAYRLSSQLAPSNLGAVTGLAQILMRTGRAGEAGQLLDAYALNYPDQRAAVAAFRGSP
jgi:thioredoxin-like negative regulator of GroEL